MNPLGKPEFWQTLAYYNSDLSIPFVAQARTELDVLSFILSNARTIGKVGTLEASGLLS